MKKMKKKLIALTLCCSFLLTGCSGATVSRLIRIFSDVADIAEDASETSSEVNEIAATPEPKESKVTFKKKAKIDFWEVTILKAEVKDSQKTSSHILYQPSKGNKFIAVKIKVKNTSQAAATFLPTSGMQNTMITAKLLDINDTETLPTQLINYDKDLIGKSIKAGETRKGFAFYELSKENANKLATMTLKLGTISEYLTCPLSL